MTYMFAATKQKPSKPSKKPWKARPEQRKAVKFMLGQTSGGLFLDPGLGKTSITLKAFDVLRTERMVERALVVAPRRVARQVWPAEVREWDDFHHLRMAVLHGKDKEEALRTDADIYVVNPDGLPWLLEQNAKLFKKLGITMLVVDESSKFKYTNTQRFKLLKPWLRTFERRWALTGSPMPKSYLDLFGQVYLIDLGGAMGEYITHYRMTYFYPSGFGGYTWKLTPGAEKQINNLLKPLVLRLDAEDYIQMPKLVHNVIRVDLPEEARKVYDDMEEHMFALLDKGTEVEALSSGAAMNKCCQIANGGVYYYELLSDQIGKRKQKELHDAKVEALVDLVDELQGQQLLIGYEFKHDAARIQKALGKKNCTVVDSGTSDRESQRIEDAWNAGEITNLVAHPASMGHGLNMQKSHAYNLCWFGIPWDYELYDQFIRRLRRSGNKAANMFVHHIVVRDTVDEAKMRALRSKQHGQQGLLDALRTYRKARKG